MRKYAKFDLYKTETELGSLPEKALIHCGLYMQSQQEDKILKTSLFQDLNAILSFLKYIILKVFFGLTAHPLFYLCFINKAHSKKLPNQYLLIAIVKCSFFKVLKNSQTLLAQTNPLYLKHS